MHRASGGQSAKIFTQITFAACLFLLLPVRCLADVLTGRVVGVTDGDTVVLVDNSRISHKIRLAGIDAPEKGQPFSARSKENLVGMIFGKQVSVEFSKHDKYGRVIGKVVLDGADVNLMQIKEGLAWHYKKYEKEQSPSDRETYASAEQIARTQRRGLWADKAPVPPWEFRRKKKN
ncbi:MAG: thermonuclease family protein [Rhodocyclaceae bacterium]|nr:thermonuclease family protein [Rhodocyclaceae bacterium]